MNGTSSAANPARLSRDGGERSGERQERQPEHPHPVDPTAVDVRNPRLSNRYAVPATAKNVAPRPSSHHTGSGRQRTIASAATATTMRTRSPMGYDRLVTVSANGTPWATRR